MVLTKPDFDVAIIGGGPAGSSMGAYLAKAGVSCVVFERELFPVPTWVSRWFLLRPACSATSIFCL